MNSNFFLTRIRIVSFGIVFLAVIFTIRLFFVQVIHNNDYLDQADKNYVTSSSEVFDRGMIFFKKRDGGLVSAATIVAGFKLTLNPSRIVDANALYTALSPIVPLKRESFDSRVENRRDTYADFPDRLTKEQADQISALKLPGVQVIKKKWRFYPGGSLAAHALGFVGFKGDDYSGRYGLERFYNDVLSRKKDSLYLNPFAEVFSNIKHTLFTNTTREGDIQITIDPLVQGYVEKTLSGIEDKWHPDLAGAIIMDPKTGRIYAMAVSPTYDPNDFSKISNPLKFADPFVENVFEFGSVIKPLVMSAALDAGVVTPQTTYTDHGSLVIKDKTISNFDKRGRGPNTTMQTVLDQSLNTGMVFTMQRLGKEKFKEYMLAYKIGEKTAVDLPNETTGLISNLKTMGDVEYANASFGQGIALTPVAVMRAFAVLANGGYLVTPHLVESISYPDGTSKKIEHSVDMTHPLLKPETTRTIATMLTHVVDTAMGNGKYKMEHYTIAAKTGTAQVAREDGKGYYDDRNMHSLFGFYPATNPQFLVLYFVTYPKGAQYAIESLGDPFFNTAKFLLTYYEVPPDR